MAAESTEPGLLKRWAIAVRPFAYTASMLPVVLGLALAHYLGYRMLWGRFVLTLLGVFCFHTGANLLSDCYDYRRGLDTEPEPLSGAVVRGLLTPEQVFRASLVFFALGVGCGLTLVYLAGWVVLALGLAGTLLSAGYTAPGLKLKCRGVGDAAIFLCFGPLAVFGTFWVQTETVRAAPVLWSLPVVMFTVAILHANNWRDMESDRARGCRTVAALLGHAGSAAYYRGLVLGPHALILLYVVLGAVRNVGLSAPPTALLVLAALPASLKLVANSRKRRSEAEAEAFRTLDGQTAKVHLLFSSLLTVGLFLAPHLPELR
ncbi:MAG: prenyltransferase [Planctomycetota bacterium]